MEILKKPAEKSALFLLYISTILGCLVGTTALSHSYQIYLMVVMLFCGAVCLHLFLEGRLKTCIKKSGVLGLFFSIMTVISTVKYGIALQEHQEISFFTVYQMVFFAAGGLCAYWMMRGHKQELRNVLAILSCAISLIILLFSRRFMLDLGVFRFMAPYSSPNILGIYTIVGLFASILMVTFCTRKYWRILFLFNAAVSAAAALLTGSRGTTLSVLFGLGVYTLCSLHLLKKVNWKIVGARLIIFTVLCGMMFLLMVPSDHKKLDVVVVGNGGAEFDDGMGSMDPMGEYLPDGEENEREEHPTVSSDSWKNFLQRFNLSGEGNSSFKHNLRLRIWLGYLQELPQYVLVGTDYQFSARPVLDGRGWDPHNTFIYTTFRFGIAELVVLCCMLLTIFRKLLKQRKSSDKAVLLGLLAAAVFQAMFIDLLNVTIFYGLLAILYAGAAGSSEIAEP